MTGRLGVVAALLLVAACSDSEPEPDDLDLIRVEKPGFAIEMPGEPEVAYKPVEFGGMTLEVVVYGVETEDGIIAVSVFDLPPEVAVDIEGAAQGSADELGGEVVEQSRTAYDGFDALDYRLTYAKEGTDHTVFARAIATTDLLVSVEQIVEGDDVTEAPQLYDAVVESLELSERGMVTPQG